MSHGSDSPEAYPHRVARRIRSPLFLANKLDLKERKDPGRRFLQEVPIHARSPGFYVRQEL